MAGAVARDLGYNDDTDGKAYAALRVRKRYPNDQLVQDTAVLDERKQFLDETTNHDSMGVVRGAVVTALSAGYSGAKYLAEEERKSNRSSALGMASQALVDYVGTGEAKTSKASWDEVFAAGEGYARGLKRRFKR